MYKRIMMSLAAATTTALATAGAAQAQAYGPRPAYAAGGWSDEGGCRGGQFTLAGAHAGVTVLGIDVGASAGLHVGLHDRCGGGRPVVYAPAPAEYGPPPGYGPPESYGPPAGYGDVGYLPQPAYIQPGYAYGAGGYSAGSYGATGYIGGAYGPGASGYVYAAPAGYGYGRPCGC